MPRIFLAIAIVLTLVSGAVNLQTKGKIKEAREELDAAKSSLTAANGERDKAKSESKALQQKLTETTAKKDETERQLASAKQAAEKAVKDLADAKGNAGDLQRQLESAKQQAAASAQTTPAVDPELESKLKEALAALDEQKQIGSTLQAKAKEAEDKAKVLEKEKSDRENHLMKPGIEGKILAVSPGWNFVVLSIGDKQGVLTSGTLIVKRGASMIAKVRVSSVEPSTSVADVLSGSMKRSNPIQPGDAVIFTGSGS
jgi:hypothetical protein